MILLDTHAWVWWVSDPARIPAPAEEAIRASLAAGLPIHVSAISAWEVALLVERGRLHLTLDVDAWLSLCEAAPELRFVPLDPRVALRAVRLPGFEHRDPADRMIVATALHLGATLVTADRRLREYGPLETLWD